VADTHPSLLARRSSRGIEAENADPGAFPVSLREFLRAPAMVGSPFPASPRLVARALAPLDWSRIRLLVEFGPGTGRFTRAALARLAPQARLVALETGRDFVGHLKRTIADPRLHVIEAPAQAVTEIMADYGPADCILSGIPFSTLPADDRWRIVRASREALGPDGVFVAYQMRKGVLPLLEERFSEIREDYEWRNLPPCHIYWASGYVRNAADLRRG
jgi:phospholipid N-methyltransferase